MVRLNPLQHMWMAADHQIRARVDVLMPHLPLVRLRLRVPLDAPVNIDHQIITLFLYLLDLLHNRSRVIRRKHPWVRRSSRPSPCRKNARRAQKTNLFSIFLNDLRLFRLFQIFSRPNMQNPSTVQRIARVQQCVRAII